MFVLAAAYGGLAGALLGIFQSYMPPDAFSLDTSAQLVLQTVIGGVGTLVGPAIGAVVWLVLRAELQQIPVVGSLWLFFLGAIFVLLVTLLRKGLFGTALSLWGSAPVRQRGGAVAGRPPVDAENRCERARSPGTTIETDAFRAGGARSQQSLWRTARRG